MSLATSPGHLTFVIPVRHQATVRDWPQVRDRLAITLRSVAAQEGGAWNGIVVADRQADLPPLPAGFDVVQVDRPPPRLPDRREREAFFEAVRDDKGNRLLAGLLGAPVGSHVMAVDYDDLVSRRLAALIATQPRANGWVVESGYVFSGGSEVFLRHAGFQTASGTSHILRTDLLALPSDPALANQGLVQRWLGSHLHLREDMRRRGTPLARLPFPGAIYRVGHADQAMGHPGLREYVRRLYRGDPARLAEVEARFRPLDEGLVAEFFAGKVG